MKDTTYPFVRAGALTKPNVYNFFPYKGPDFIAAYLQNRWALLGTEKWSQGARPSDAEHAACHQLDEALPAWRPRTTINCGRENCSYDPSLRRPDCKFPHEILVGDWFSTRNALEQILQVTVCRPLGHGSEEAIQEAQEWTDAFIRRFEVSKRLFEEYRRDLRQSRGRDNDRQIYIRFALILALGLSGPGRDQKLSTLLKVHDLIFSLAFDSPGKLGPQNPLAWTVVVETEAVIRLAGKNTVWF